MESEGNQRRPTKRVAFSKTRLAQLAPPATGRVYWFDEGTPGLALCVTQAGSKTYYVVRWVDGKPERIRLGKFPDVSVEQARTIAKAIVGKIAEGVDPIAERKAARNVPTLRALFDHWLETHAKLHKRTWKDDERQFNKYLGDFHNRRLSTIKTSEVATWHGRIGRDHGPVQANRSLALLATMFNASDRLGFTGPNPCDGVKRFHEESRERFLLPAEMRRFFDAVAAEGEPWRDYFMLLLFCGARRSNVAEMRWDEIDFDGAVWRIPRTKNNRPQLVPLVPPALRILEGRREIMGDSPWVFPATSASGHIVDPRKAWEHVRERAGLPDLRMHDLRRSLGSWAAAAGTSIAIIGAALGHRDLKSTQVYSRLQLDVVRDAVSKTTAAMLEAGGVVNTGTEGKSDATKTE